MGEGHHHTRTPEANSDARRFPYTPTPEIPKLVIDMDKVLARAVGYTDDETARNSELAVYGPLGWLHFDSDPEKTAELFEETGTDRVAMANTTVYRTASPRGRRNRPGRVRGAVREELPPSSPRTRRHRRTCRAPRA